MKRVSDVIASPILIANDAGSKQLVKIPPLDSISTLADLHSADVAIMGRSLSGDKLIGVEVKSLSDLIDSVSSGRLQATQIPKMIETYDVRFLCYYGDYRPHPRDGSLQVRRSQSSPWETYSSNGRGARALAWSSVESFLTSEAFLACDVRVKHCLDISTVAYWIACLHAVWTKPPEHHKSFRCFDSTKSLPSRPVGDLDPITHQIAWTASTLPNIRYERGIAAARHFRSIRAMTSAPVSAWMRIHGIGPSIAEGAVRAITAEIPDK